MPDEALDSDRLSQGQDRSCHPRGVAAQSYRLTTCAELKVSPKKSTIERLDIGGEQRSCWCEASHLVIGIFERPFVVTARGEPLAEPSKWGIFYQFGTGAIVINESGGIPWLLLNNSFHKCHARTRAPHLRFLSFSQRRISGPATLHPRGYRPRRKGLPHR